MQPTADLPSRIQITEDDISYAQRQNRWGCAIVRAVQRSRPEATFVRADAEAIAFTEHGHRYTYSTPPAAIERVIKPLDQGKPVKPTSFELGTPTIKQAQRMSEEDKVKLREHKRNAEARKKNKDLGLGKQPGQGQKNHDRFCET